MKPKHKCTKCGKTFTQWETAEEMLLQAIFGDGPLCQTCTMKRDEDLPYICSTCGQRIEKDKEFLFNDRPYHSYCLPYS